MPQSREKLIESLREGDPTRTSSTRLGYQRYVAQKLRKIAQIIRSAIVQNDVLGIPADTVRVGDELPPLAWAGFTSNAGKVVAFRQWLDDQLFQGIFEMRVEDVPRTPLERRLPLPVRRYIDTAYRKGIRDAYNSIGERSSSVAVRGSFLSPINVERVQAIYTRNFEALRGVTRVMSLRMGETLAHGLTEGHGPRRIARALRDRVEKIGITRARVIAQTEVIASHASGSLSAFREAGVVAVHNLAEFRTAGDDRVCPQCQALEGRVFTLAAAEGVIPVHPNCRCRWLPTFADEAGG